MAVTSTILFVCCISCAFAVDGGWSDWSTWSSCSATCGQATRYSFRNCDNPPPIRSGKFCPGSNLQREECPHLHNCPVDGAWSKWNPWTACSVTCGKGAQRRFRSCSDPQPQFDGKQCPGFPQESQECVLPECKRDGQWSSWSTWSKCSATCGRGSHTQYRSCNSPPPTGGGKPCVGSKRQSESCSAPIECPVDGHWSKWSDWTPCAVTCGSSEIQRHRSCNNPAPRHGGLPCPGHLSETADCEAGIECPVNGFWSDWSPYGACVSLNCFSNISYTLRQRSCNNPLPAFNGEMCQGNFQEGGLCVSPVNCPVNGEWSEWSPWNCSEKMAERTRRCDNPPPSNNGKPCPPFGSVERYSSDLEDEKYNEICGKKVDEDEDFLNNVPLNEGAEDGDDEGEGRREEELEDEYDFGM